jgi:hypothetical protein
MDVRFFIVLMALSAAMNSVSASNAPGGAPGKAPDSIARQEQIVISDYGLYTFWYKVAEFWVTNFFPATVNDTLPTFPWFILRPNPFPKRVRIDVCKRIDVATCMYYGALKHL